MLQPLQSAIWAEQDETGRILVASGARPIPMKNSDGTGVPLVSLNSFGADLIHFGAGQGVGNHTHEGDHILFVLSGEGILTYSGAKHRLYPGLCYLVPGGIDHAIDAESELILIAVGNRHFPVGSAERMALVPG